MIDLHAHILPGIDDGAGDLFDSLEMARIAAANGVTAMVATPHCNIPGMFENYLDEHYIETFRKLESALETEEIPLELYAGMEVYVTPDVPELLREGKILTLNGSRYILVEFQFEEEEGFVHRMLDEIAALGLCPVIAHAERYRFVQENPQMVYRWRKKGYVVQVNKGSLMGSFGRRVEHTAMRLLRHNLISLIASDAHSPYRRTPNMRDLYEAMLDDYSKKYVDVLFQENPRRICKNQPTVTFELRPFEEED